MVHVARREGGIPPTKHCGAERREDAGRDGAGSGSEAEVRRSATNSTRGAMRGHGRGNRAPCAGRAICASFAPLGVYIYAVGGESCTTRLPLLRSARLGPTKLRLCSKALFLWAFRSGFAVAPQSLRDFGGYAAPTVTAHGTSGRVRRVGSALGLARHSGFALGYPLATLGPHFVRRLPRSTRRCSRAFRSPSAS